MFWRRSVADQVDEELDFHLAMVTRELVERGQSEILRGDGGTQGDSKR